ncbi:hypothetical protein ABZT03_43185, partial [Streptomyces sp. NPDC005574]|uniref:hypothetical protein n=1 Tax=Streptomyces sp. NPDC005574 TaxID=3156891 RepID=UPI0033B579D3
DLSTRTEGAPMATTEQPPSDTPEAEWSKADRLANVLSYQTGLAVLQVGVSEEQGEQLARAVVRTVYEVAAGWEPSDG